MNEKQIKYGLLFAALVNIFGVLFFSWGFSNQAINNADPVVMSNFGLASIMLWGAAYFATAMMKGNRKGIVTVFVFEKLIYVVAWCQWVTFDNLSSVYSADILAGVFYTIYGLNDFFFMLFFIYVIISELGFSKRFVTTTS